MVEVRPFVLEDVPLYHNVEWKHLPGADPELVFLNHYYEELDRVPLSEMTRVEINNLLKKLGFYKRARPKDKVPIEFYRLPAKDSPFKNHHPTRENRDLLNEDKLGDISPHKDL